MENISKPVIFIGSGRSGTTIISEIVFRHESLAWPSNYQERFPSITAVNLLRVVFDNKLWRMQGQKPQLNKVSFFNKVLFKPAEAYKFWEYQTGPSIDFSRGFLINDRATENEASKIRNTFNKLVAYQFKKRLAFKITGPSRIGYLTSIFPDAVFINIVRDPLPTIKSWLNVDFWQDKGKNQLWWTGAYTKQEEEWAVKHAENPQLLAGLQYKKLQEITAIEMARYKHQCITIRYEDFVANPPAVINTIMDFAGLHKSKQVDDYLQGITVYDQNKEQKDKKKSNDGTEMSDLQMILEGKYTF